ncbi:MAG: alkylphosphonate utilization protein [Halothiobacillaceae bacterium]|nr:alkylphosphonate utilization protein [Halothiobacillaceae bacterium]HUN00298.1 zinc ribbon domain-containing protein YjdM [Halothiobacillus sp.]
MTTPACPQCGQTNTYPDGELFICADCGFEWAAAETEARDDARVVRDANGTVLTDGDAVTLIKDLKVKGSSITLKVGSKIKSIRIVDGDHELDCKTEAGPMMLKACFVKKA